ncbi:MAG: hypothetical protein HZT40_06955 [Candidatus Thiothrix singaporensis]|uniref:Uncharacterized protein n=1 Tax=Candidatus Thiothrix singaporensis TaxID=2799669 RepID=A0A7L6AQI9_9GAMM|nr:MAG: hypothetical protein HZT40_06955 [Candidatus Thiothrix singaporensis]
METILKSDFYANDTDFREIIDAIARGMGLSVIRIGHRVGIVLGVQDESSPFSPGLTWLGNRLSNTQQHNRDELHCFAVLTLTALLSEAFPNQHSTGLEWSSPAQFNAEDVLKNLHDLASEIVSQTNDPGTLDKNTFMSAARMICENRIPKYPQTETGRTSASRSQYDFIKSWIRLLEEHGLLIEEPGYKEEDIRWMATDRLKIYIGQAAIVPLVELLMNIEETGQDIAQTDADIDIRPDDKTTQNELF